MAERPMVAELRAVDAALAPLAPSRELDSRIDALLAGRAPRATQRRVALGALGACAAAAAVALWLGRAGDDAVALGHVPERQHSPLLEEPRELERSPEIGGAQMTLPAASPGVGGGASRRPVQPREGAAGAQSLALADAAAGNAAPAPLAASARAAALALPAPSDAAAAMEASPRRDVSRTGAPRAALVARAGIDPGTDDLEEALRALRADKSRGDLKGAVARIDGLLADGVGARATDILRVERARLQERLGDRAAACAGLQGLPGDDAQDARLRLACP